MTSVNRTRRCSLSFMVAAVMIAATAGCATHPGGIAPSTKPLTPGSYTVLGDVAGKDCVYYLLGILPLSGGNELKDAVADAISEKKGADALIEVTVDGYMEYWILWSRVCTQVYGKAVQSK
ncbi:MAG: hypothetical protein AB7G48_01205 [Nitrospiraceae bacterium]